MDSHGNSREFPPVVRLNVGGQMFTTSLSTLTKYRNSMLGAMFSGMVGVASYRDENGSEIFFIDRSGNAFGSILQFLRDDFLSHIPRGADERSELVREAQFYSIAPLLDSVRDIPGCGNAGVRAAFDDIYLESQRYFDGAVRHFMACLHRVMSYGAMEGVVEAVLDAQFFGQPGSFTLELCGDVRPRPRAQPVASTSGSATANTSTITNGSGMAFSGSVHSAPRRVVDLYEGADAETAARILDLVYDANAGREAHNPLVESILASGVTIMRVRATTHWAQWRLILTGDSRGTYVNPAPYALGAAAAAAEGLPTSTSRSLMYHKGGAYNMGPMGVGMGVGVHGGQGMGYAYGTGGQGVMKPAAKHLAAPAHSRSVAANGPHTGPHRTQKVGRDRDTFGSGVSAVRADSSPSGPRASAGSVLASAHCAEGQGALGIAQERERAGSPLLPLLGLGRTLSLREEWRGRPTSEGNGTGVGPGSAATGRTTTASPSLAPLSFNMARPYLAMARTSQASPCPEPGPVAPVLTSIQDAGAGAPSLPAGGDALDDDEERRDGEGEDDDDDEELDGGDEEEGEEGVISLVLQPHWHVAPPPPPPLHPDPNPHVS